MTAKIRSRQCSAINGCRAGERTTCDVCRCDPFASALVAQRNSSSVLVAVRTNKLTVVVFVIVIVVVGVVVVVVVVVAEFVKFSSAA